MNRDKLLGLALLICSTAVSGLILTWAATSW